MSVRAPRVAVAPIDGNLAASAARFCRLLRLWGLRLPAGCAQIGLEALSAIDITHRYDFRSALRIALLTRPEDFQLFDYLFNAFWSIHSGKVNPPSLSAPESTESDARENEDEHTDHGRGDLIIAQQGVAEDVNAAKTPEDFRTLLLAARIGASEARKHRPILPGDQAELDRLATALARQLASRRSRRYESHPHGDKLDLRGSLRRSLRYGGVPIELRWRRAQVSRSQLLIFCDVSRSMSEYSTLFLQFAAAALRRVWRVEVFLFASELKRVTELWRDKNWSEIEGAIPGCGGGTQFGACLENFFRDYDRGLLGRDTTAIILSDGLDAGEPQLIADTMRRLQRHCRKIVWLNPLLRLEGYLPTARGMAAALEFVNVFAPAHNLASFWELVKVLGEKHERRA